MTSVNGLVRGLVHAALQAASCGLHRRSGAAVAACVLVLTSLGAATPADPDSPLAPRLGTLPLPAPLTLTDLYGEVRGSHLHAGLDLRAALGTPVRAPARLVLERVRASGSGYGRSLYMRTSTGELLVFGHLDAFAPAIAGHVDSLQRADGRYEQDLWPEPGRFTFAQGETIAWTGESGAGPPHLHFEVRHGDFALNPLRAGIPLPDAVRPSIVSLVLEPLDDSSRVAGSARPWLTRFAAARETVTVRGRVRAYVRARDRVGGADAYAWSTALAWRGESVEARLDSISWAGEMAELDWLIDRGQARSARGLLLWAPAGWRPRLLRTSAPLARESGTIEVAVGDAAAPLELVARDVAGNEARRTLWIRGEREGTAAPPPGPAFEPADPRAGAWLTLASGGPSERLTGVWLSAANGYQPTRTRLDAPARELRPGDRFSSTPQVVPLRRPLRLVVDVGHTAARLSGWGLRRISFPGGSIEWLSLDAVPGTGLLATDVTRLGAFTLVRDTAAPILGTVRVVHVGVRAPYSRWGIEVGVSDALSGIDARASHLTIDGVRVPTEYDSDARALRWRPSERLRAASVQVEVVATDRVGRSARRRTRLVLDSATRR